MELFLIIWDLSALLSVIPNIGPIFIIHSYFPFYQKGILFDSGLVVCYLTAVEMVAFVLDGG